MPVEDIHQLNHLCRRCGISLEYYDIRGQRHEPSLEVKLSLLAALQLPVDSDEDIRRNFDTLESYHWQAMVAPVLVHRLQHQPLQLTLSLNAEQLEKAIAWQICEESGQIHQGSWQILAQDALAEAVVDGNRLMQFAVYLPELGNTGYHQLGITAGDGSEASASLIIAPATCYQPDEFEAGKKIWGIGLQLYSLRSHRNWGIGDFSDLRTTIELLAPYGVQVLGLNPLHALFMLQPEKASPYSPSSRNFLNPVYLDIEAIAEFGQCPEAQQRVHSEEFQASLQALRAEELIDYAKVWKNKSALLEILYQAFRREHLDTSSSRADAFRQFQQEGGTELFNFGVFEALQAFFHEQDASIGSWQLWPEDYKNPDSKAVNEWAKTHTDEIEFHHYLQWNTDQQLESIQVACKQHGMCLGIYRDLAVGNEKTGALCWAEQSEYALGMGIGAPPDDFNLKGQDWGLPPPVPRAIYKQAYRQFIHSLRANMRHAGALRIDHIMGLMRLFWVPPGFPPDQGTYVAYPFADLLAILALESQRNRCLIIGEDLGTVPDDVRHALLSNHILSYRILYFEKDWQQGTINSPGQYPHYSLCTTGSHDLPTLRGFWQGTDLDLREQLDLYPSDEYASQQRQLRRQDREQIIAALAREELPGSSQAMDGDSSASELSEQLALSIQRYLARSNAALLMIQLEDLLAQTGQVNLPGTVDEYPNWRGKISLPLEAWEGSIDLEGFAQAVSDERCR